MSSLPILNQQDPSGIEGLPKPQKSRGEWQKQLADSIRDPATLLSLLGLGHLASEFAAKTAFPMLVPHSFVQRMTAGDPNDPLLRQVLPMAHENEKVRGFVNDPVDDAAAREAQGLLHKYQGRALLIAAGTCAVHCRYCFRREYPYQNDPRSPDEWQPALQAIADNPDIDEVILSGGDPLTLSDNRLRMLVESVVAIPQIRRLRIHTRLPIVLPARVTQALLSILKGISIQPILVVHANHANEIAADCRETLRRIVQNGIPVLNQAVLLRGINDSVAAQESLCSRLTNIGVMPYYLHQLDRVAGAAHFECPENIGTEIIRELRNRLPGYAVPRFVREIPGEPGKTHLPRPTRGIGLSD